jgi:hypothetical protein
VGLPPGDFSSLDDIPIDEVPAPAPPDTNSSPDFTLAAPGSQISFATAQVSPASQPGVYIGPADSVLLTAYNSNNLLTSVTCQLRILNPDGTITITALTIPNVPANRTAASAVFTTTEGWILGAVMGPPGVAVSRGQCFVTLAVVRGAPPTQLVTMALIADYLTTAFQPSWPWGTLKSAVDGSGYIATYQQAPPGGAGGPELNQPPNTRWRVMAAFCEYITGAGAGNRNILFEIVPAGGGLLVFGCNTNQPPSISYNYTWGVTLQLGPSAPNAVQGNTPQNIITLGGTVYSVQAEGYSVGDVYDNLQVQVEEWIDV